MKMVLTNVPNWLVWLILTGIALTVFWYIIKLWWK